MLTLLKCNYGDTIARLGGLFCDDEQVLGMIFLERSVRFDPATFSKTILDGFIQQDKVIGTVKIDSGEDANVDVSFTETSMGESIQNHQGLKKWNFTFYKGGRFQNELQKLNKSENYSVMFVMKNDSILAQQMKDGTIKGFDCKLFVGIRNVKTAAEGGGSTLRVDLTPTAMSYWQGSSATYSSDEIDFRELQPIAALELQVPVLVAAATTTSIKILQAGSGSQMIGLDDKDNWQILSDGVPLTISNLTSVAGTYTFTHPALVVDKEIVFKTNMTGYPVYVLDNGYYVGESMPKKVTA